MRTIARILVRCQMVRRRKRRAIDRGWSLQRARRSVVVERPNDLWTVDFKGWWLTRDGRRCEPLTVRDALSRYVLALRILPATDGETVRAVFEELFERHGLPRVIQSDNGPPFAATSSLCGLTKLSAWWLSLGIEVVRSRPGCPQDNSGHERMHGDIRVELQTDAAASLEAQQAACDEWRVEFNHVRPHDALGLKTPADVYVPSERRMRHVLMGGYFPGGCDIVPLDSRGGFSYLGQKVFVSKALVRAKVGIERVGADGELRVWFHRQLLGFIRPIDGAPEVPVTPYAEPDLPSVVTLSTGAGAAGGDSAGDRGGDIAGSSATAPSTADRDGGISKGSISNETRDGFAFSCGKPADGLSTRKPQPPDTAVVQEEKIGSDRLSNRALAVTLA